MLQELKDDEKWNIGKKIDINKNLRIKYRRK